MYSIDKCIYLIFSSEFEFSFAVDWYLSHVTKPYVEIP
eukprot:COSAG02_NODE_39229_length_419_cov_1.275000_1_plen_37_part_01